MFNRILLTAVIALVLPVFQVRATSADIVITEIGAYEASDHEWIEIYNKGFDPVDLTNWKFFEENTNHGLTAYRGDLIIAAGEYAIIADAASNFAADYPNFFGTLIDSSWSILKESGEPIALKDASGTIVESFSYIAAGSGSLERVNPQLTDYSSNNWKENGAGNTAGLPNNESGIRNQELGNNAAPTTNTVNSSTNNQITSSPNPSRPQASNLPPYRAGTLVINEFLSEPGDDAVEWIEIFSKGETVINLDGWRIEDGLGEIAELGGGMFPQSFRVLELQNSRLNNAGDTVKLMDDKGAIIDQVTYGNFDDGDEHNNAPRPKYPNVLARIGDGIDTDRDDADWSLTASATPNARNSVAHTSQEEIIEEEIDPSIQASTVGVVAPSVERSSYVRAAANDSNGSYEGGGSNKKIRKEGDTAQKTKQQKSYVGVRIVNGIVSVLPGVLGSQIFYVQTSYGGEEIYMFKKDFPELALGDEVRITGKTGTIRGRSRLKVQNRGDIQALSHGESLEAGEVAIGEIGEDNDSSLVKVRGEIIEIKGRGQFVMSDGDGEILVYAKQGTGIGALALEEGSEITVSGIVNMLESGPRLLPRGSGDIELPARELEATTETFASSILLGRDQVIAILIALIIVFGAVAAALAFRFKDKIFTFFSKPQEVVEEEIELDEY